MHQDVSQSSRRGQRNRHQTCQACQQMEGYGRKQLQGMVTSVTNGLKNICKTIQWLNCTNSGNTQSTARCCVSGASGSNETWKMSVTCQLLTWLWIKNLSSQLLWMQEHRGTASNIFKANVQSQSARVQFLLNSKQGKKMETLPKKAKQCVWKSHILHLASCNWGPDKPHCSGCFWMSPANPVGKLFAAYIQQRKKSENWSLFENHPYRHFTGWQPPNAL